MSTTKTRINISVSSDVRRALARLAKRDAMPEATKAAELIHRALEIEEDEVWEAVASKRDMRGARFLSHASVWA